MITIRTRVKQAGKKKDILTEQPYSLEPTPTTLKELLTALVATNVEEFNRDSTSLLPYLTNEQMEEAASIGEISFGERKNQELQEISPAIENALQSFEDGLYLVFLNGEELKTLETPIELKENDEVLLIRLMMLAGRLW